MTLSVFIAKFFSISLLVIGLSHALQSTYWRDFFLFLKKTGVAGIIIAMYTFPLGLLIVIGHNKWVFGLPVIITILGWGMTLKGIVYALFPKKVEAVIAENSKGYAYGGWLLIPLGLVMIWESFLRSA